MTTQAKPLPSSIFKFPSMEQLERERKRLRRREITKKFILGTLSVIITTAAAAALIATLVLPIMQISGSSMAPTLEDGDIVILLKTDNVSSGDLCSFAWNNRTLVKRIIGVAGDTVDIDENGVVSVNGTALDERYISEAAVGECDITLPMQVPENCFFVLGDNRADSADSRSSVIGCVEREQIIGKVLFRVWPLNGIGTIN